MPNPTDPLPHIRELARQGLSITQDARVHADAKGEVRLSLAGLAPMALALLDRDRTQAQAELKKQTAVLESAFGKIGGWASKRAVDACDGMGHVRPVYGALYAHVLLRALAFAHPVTPETLCEHNAAAEAGEKLMELLCGTKIGAWRNGPADDLAMVPWLNLLSAAQSAALAQPFTHQHQAQNALESVAPETENAGALHAQGIGDTQDTWVYREMTALHALDRLACMTGSPELAARAKAACLYHQAHTQPDYTTYQPWALGAFLRQPETRSFADQQLHDVAAHFAIEGGPGAAVAALLLADAAG